MRVTKHHGLGNDFLVGLVSPGHPALDGGGALARRWCDRRRGAGADGLILGERSGGTDAPDAPDITMHLWNADGGRAEMSGNGIRCLAQAVALAADLPVERLEIRTDGGRRRVELARTDDPTELAVSVEMGGVLPGPIAPPAVRDRLEALGATHHATAELGNPHLVAVVDDPDAVDLVVEGPAIEAGFPTGMNVELVTPTPEGLRLRVWERGVGLTQACGTGACAAASLAHGWGLVGERVQVFMPGGDAAVILDGTDVTLVGPSVHVATIDLADDAARDLAAEVDHG